MFGSKKTKLRLVKCYIVECDCEVVREIQPTHSKLKGDRIFVCQRHFDTLRQIHLKPDEEKLGWFATIWSKK